MVNCELSNKGLFLFIDMVHPKKGSKKLLNAWAMKIQSTDLKGEASEVAVESITVVHEGLEILNEG